jgi:hypothetical protein
MNKVAIAFSTKDRVELSKQSIEPLLQPDKFDLFWIDGSKTKDGEELPFPYLGRFVHKGNSCIIRSNVIGGADAAIAFSLTTMLQHPNNYEYVGLVENDVLLDADWFEQTMELFVRGRNDGLEPGAVSARSYEDRILIQCDGYAVMHNLGAGMVIFSRKAAELVLQNFRTGWTTENRRTFMQVSGLDIARWAPFVQQPHVTCADWQFERILAQHGLVSLALTPAKCRMIGQEPSLEEQGLIPTTGPVEERRNDNAFDTLVSRTELIRNGDMRMPDSLFLQTDDGGYTIFPHQIEMLGGGYEGDWSLKWCQGFGPFAWKAGSGGRALYMENGAVDMFNGRVVVPISGPCALIVSGGETGGKINVVDEQSGYEMTLDVAPEGNSMTMMQVQIPGNIAYRVVRLTALSPGIVFYGISVREPQPFLPAFKFDHSRLPSP